MSKSTITDQLYSTVEKTLVNRGTLKEYKDGIDKYLALNTDKYFSQGIGDRPIFSEQDKDAFIRLTGLTKEQIKKTLKDSKNIGSSWYIMNDPFNIANVLATRYFSIKKNAEGIKYSKWYLIVSMYPSLHWKYFQKCNPNAACMDYTINNLSGKYHIRQYGSLWNALVAMIDNTYDFYKDRIIEGSDLNFVKYVQDVHTRMNSLLKNISNQYYENYKNQRYLGVEHESFDEDSYHEADSNTYAIERLTNKVVTHLVVNGPDMRLVEIAAKTNQVSVNELRNYTQSMINDRRRNEIREVVEAILFLYLFNTDGEIHSQKDIGTNNFMIYCLKIYKRSNTTDKNIIKIKTVLDKWLKEVGLFEATSRQATIINFRKALFTFFVLTIQRMA